MEAVCAMYIYLEKLGEDIVRYSLYESTKSKEPDGYSPVFYLSEDHDLILRSIKECEETIGKELVPLPKRTNQFKKFINGAL